MTVIHKVAPHQMKALALFETYTRGSFDVYRMSGPYAASDRQIVLSTLTQSKLPKSKCGITNIREAFMQLASDNGAKDALESASCLAIREDVFSDWAKAQINLAQA